MSKVRSGVLLELPQLGSRYVTDDARLFTREDLRGVDYYEVEHWLSSSNRFRLGLYTTEKTPFASTRAPKRMVPHKALFEGQG